MSKSVLTIDTPKKGCISCHLSQEKTDYLKVCIVTCMITNKTILGAQAETIPDWCPLKPLPEKMAIPRGARNVDGLEYAAGYNTCINEITGGNIDDEFSK